MTSAPVVMEMAGILEMRNLTAPTVILLDLCERRGKKSD